MKELMLWHFCIKDYFIHYFIQMEILIHIDRIRLFSLKTTGIKAEK